MPVRHDTAKTFSQEFTVTKFDAAAAERARAEGTVYLICLEDKLGGRARHYLGWARRLYARLSYHGTKSGAKMLWHARERGIGWIVVRVWAGDKAMEAHFKRIKAAPDLCPRCRRRPPLPARFAVELWRWRSDRPGETIALRRSAPGRRRSGVRLNHHLIAFPAPAGVPGDDLIF